MTILVTGGTGYIGSATVERLRTKGEHVVVLDDLYRGHRCAIDKNVPLYEGRVSDRALVARIASEHAIDSCVHFAALTYVGESVQDPRTYYENNLEQGIAFVGALVKGGVMKIVLSSTAAVYGEPKVVPITESCPQWPVNPYGWSKFMMERLLASYDTAYGMKSVSLRYFNAAGATERCGELHEPETHLVPNLLKAAAGETPHIRVFGTDYPTPDGTAVRDYVHVADLAEAHVLAIEYLRGGGDSDCLNLGSGDGFSVMEVIEMARKVTGRPIPMKVEGRRAGDPPKLVADAGRAKKVLGWNPMHSDLSTILRTQWDWRLKHPNGYPK
ncbi:MAG TPA: UDP-glucose 4-epimerase GalE [Candidatus Acidoferrales bacterium]|nr:UDP-glucose 4-epimerase GalE [Candidatus Acidoferrales bacterium]